jgi:DNA repair protein RadC
MPTPKPTRPYTIPGFRIALVREPGVRLAERPELRSAAEAVPILAQFIGETDREVFAIALLTVRHRLLGLHTVSVGCLTASLVHCREVFKPAILAGSAAILAAHNHPSGDPEPSAASPSPAASLRPPAARDQVSLPDHRRVGPGVSPSAGPVGARQSEDSRVVFS